MAMYINWQNKLLQRVVTGAALVLILAVFFVFRLLTVWIFDAFILVLALLAVIEVMRCKQSHKKGVHLVYVIPYMVIAYSMFVLGYIAEFGFWFHIAIQVIVIAVFALYVLLMNYMDKDFIKECAIKKVGVGKAATHSTLEFLKIVLYPIVLLFSLIPLNHLGEFITTEGGIFVPEFATFALVLVFMIACFTDTFAYAAGMTLRGPKLLPKKFNYISPNKTISGFIGGLFGGVTGALMTVLIFVPNESTIQEFIAENFGYAGWATFWFIMIGLIGAVINTAGDLYASYLKRKAGIKDMGNVLPGHGGIMDRIDGILFTSMFICVVFLTIVAF